MCDSWSSCGPTQAIFRSVNPETCRNAKVELAWKNFGCAASSSVIHEVYQSGVLPVTIGNPIEPTTVRMLDAVPGPWIIFARSVSLQTPLNLLRSLLTCRRWVGGVVGERSFKFFLQFNFYSFLLSTFTMSALAYFVAERKEGPSLAVQWIIALGLSGFFCLFTMGIFINSLRMALRNVTSIEDVNSHTRTVLLAVLLPPELQGEKFSIPPPPPQAHPPADMSLKRSADSDRPLTSDLNDPSHSSYFLNLQNSRPPRRSSVLPYQDRIWRGTVTYPLQLQTDRPPLPAPTPKTFAILETLPGMNVWDLGGGCRNLQTILGSSLHEWLLPIKHSPCCDHSSMISQFPLGPDFEELLIEAGLTPRPISSAPPQQLPIDATPSALSRNRRRKPRLDPGWQNGERPDGWLSEKEARRLRNEARRTTRDGLG